jgi:hypothetical protein
MRQQAKSRSIKIVKKRRVKKSSPAKENIDLVALLISLFVFALNIPGISYSIIIVAFAVLVIPLISKTLNIFIHKIRRTFPFAMKFIVALIPLCLFSVTYFPTVFNYGYIDDVTSVRSIILTIAAYIIGYSINFKQLPFKPFNYIYVYLALIAGGVVFVFLSVNTSAVADILNRSASNFWRPEDEPVNGPVLDLYLMLGMSLIPFIFYCKNSLLGHKQYNFIVAVSGGLGLISLYTNILLQGRKAILSLAIVYVIATLFKLKNIKRKNTRHTYTFLVIFGVMGLLLAFNSLSEIAVKNFEVFDRFQNEGLESGRYQAWGEILAAMPNNLMGGRAFVISEAYAHNIWLDAFYDGGFLPTISLLFFHILHIKPIFKIVSSKLPETLVILVICVMIPTLIGFQGEPVLQASITYFATSCFFFGTVMRLSDIADLY